MSGGTGAPLCNADAYAVYFCPAVGPYEYIFDAVYNACFNKVAALRVHFYNYVRRADFELLWVYYILRAYFCGAEAFFILLAKGGNAFVRYETAGGSSSLLSLCFSITAESSPCTACTTR
mgnify:CR=1 FL=1